MTEATKSSANPTPCPGGESSSILTWDGKTAISCADGVSASGGNITAIGSIGVGQNNNACTADLAGTMRYNKSTNIMEYCNGTVWGSFGGGRCMDTTVNASLGLFAPSSGLPSGTTLTLTGFYPGCVQDTNSGTYLYVCDNATWRYIALIGGECSTSAGQGD